MLPTIQVLLVEDDEGEAFHISKMLGLAEEASFEVTHVVSLRAALQLLEMREFDIVLLDLSLPDSHGFETVTAFAKRSDVPFIVLTGNDDIEMAMRTTRLGAQDYQLKADVKAKSLERTICMAVNKAQSEKEKRRRSYETLNQFMPPDRATVALLSPRVSHLIEAFEDLEGYLRHNAPGVMEDVGALMNKHKVSETIQETRNILRLHSSKGKIKGRTHISDAAMKILSSVADKRASKAPEDWSEAESAFDEIAAKGST